MATYEIHYSLPRARRGLPCWGVFDLVDSGLSVAMSSFQTEVEAKAEVSRLEAIHPAIAIAHERIRNGWGFKGDALDPHEAPTVSEGDDGTWVTAWVFIERDAYSDKPED